MDTLKLYFEVLWYRLIVVLWELIGRQEQSRKGGGLVKKTRVLSFPQIFPRVLHVIGIA